MHISRTPPHFPPAATLDTLNVYLTWVPLGYIFESNLVELLLQVWMWYGRYGGAGVCLCEELH